LDPSRSEQPLSPPTAPTTKAEDTAGDMVDQAPADYQVVQTTELEEAFRLAMQGADNTWLLNSSALLPTVPDSGIPTTDEDCQRFNTHKELEKAGAFEGLEQAPDYLGSHVRAKIVRKHRAETASAAEVLEEVMQWGNIKLEEEGEKLEGRIDTRCAGPCGADVVFGDNIWNVSCALLGEILVLFTCIAPSWE